MGLGSFMQNFAIGALGQLNEGFSEMHRQQAYEDAQNANMVREVSMNAINRYNDADRKASVDLDKQNLLVKVWGPLAASALENGASFSDLQYIQQTGNMPADTHADDLDTKRWNMYQDTLKTVQTSPNNHKIKGNFDWGQVFQPPKPFGSGKGFTGATPVQQQQISQLHGQSQGDTITPAPQGGSVTGGPLGSGQQNSGEGGPMGGPTAPPTASGVPAVPIGQYAQWRAKPDLSPNNQSMLALDKNIQQTSAGIVKTYFSKGEVQTGADGSTNYHFDDVNANQLVQNIQVFGREIASKLAAQRGTDPSLRPQDIDVGAVNNAMMAGTRMLIDDLRAHGYQEDVGVRVLGAMTPQEFSKAIWDARDDAQQRSQAKQQGVGPNQVGSYLDIKNHPNDPNVGLVQKHYDTVVQLVQQYHNDPRSKGGYPGNMTDDSAKEAGQFNKRYGNRLMDKDGKPAPYTPKATQISKEQAQAMVNALPLQDYMKLVQVLEADVQRQKLQQQNVPEQSEINAEPDAQAGDSGDGLVVEQPKTVTPSRKDANGNPIVNPAEEGQ